MVIGIGTRGSNVQLSVDVGCRMIYYLLTGITSCAGFDLPAYLHRYCRVIVGFQQNQPTSDPYN